MKTKVFETKFKTILYNFQELSDNRHKYSNKRAQQFTLFFSYTYSANQHFQQFQTFQGKQKQIIQLDREIEVFLQIKKMKVESIQKMPRHISSKLGYMQSPLTTIKSHESLGFNGGLLGSRYQKLCDNNQKSLLRCGIEDKYLNSIHYLSTCQFAKKRNILYRLYCTAIRDYYSYFNFLYQKCHNKIKPERDKHQKLSFITEFKSLIYQFVSIFKEVSVVQISYFESLEDDIARRQYSLEWNTNQFIDKLQTYKKSQQQFQEKAKIHTNQLQEIYYKYQNLKKDNKDPYSFFNRKNSSKKANELIESLKKQQITRQCLRKDLNEVYDNSTQFQSNLILYRQQLFNNKYKIMKKLTQISKSSRNSLAEFLVYLFECVSRKSQDFSKLLKKSHNPTSRKRTKSFSHHEDKLAIESYLIEVINEYNRTIDEIEAVIQSIADIFEELRKFTTNQMQSKRKILELMNTVYDVDQNPDNEVSKTLNFYQDFSTKIFEINNGINIATNELAKLKKETKKLAEITLSLVRNSKISQKTLDVEFNDSTHHSQIEILLEKLSYDYPINLIQSIYKDFQKNMTHLKNDASQKFHMKKRRLMDSMEISHFEDQTLVQPKKRICKKQIWLWQKWQNQPNFKIDQFKISSLLQIKQFATKIILQIPEAKQIDRFSCSLQTKGQTAGFLIITDKYVKFETSQGNCVLLILLEEIEDIKIVVKMFGKIVALSTTNGLVCLRGCVDPQKLFESIEEVRNNSGAPVMKPPRSIVEVTVEELAYMEQRKNNIKGQLPKLQEFSFVQEAVIQDISIDHLFELIYSDKEVNIRGKTQPNFFAYTMKRNGASNFEVTKYDSIGPKFFSHEEGVTFLNCPLFSMRITNYDVKLPPVPFMPKYAHNRQENKLFWVSHEQFYYLIHNNASGAPKADTFFIQILHKIEKKDEKSSKIAFYWRIVFSEDSFLKSTIQSSAASEAKKGILASLTDIKKYSQIVSASSTGENKGSQQMMDREDQNQDQQKNQTAKGPLGQFIGMLVAAIKKLISKPKADDNKKEEGDKVGTTAGQSKSTININILLILLTAVLFLNLVVHFFKSDK